MYTETFDDGIQDKQPKIYNGSRSRKNSNHEVINGSGSSSDDSSEGQIDVNGTKSLSASARRSSSSSSSESSSDDFFRTGALNFTTSDASALASKSGKNYPFSSESSAKSDVDNSPPAPNPTYQVFNLSYSQKGMSPTASPPIQVMDRSGGYESSRIPSSVFERTTNPLEWSIASNESLFSLHIGQSSFPRENPFMFGDIGMSEELTKSDELNMFNRIPSVKVEEIDNARKSVDSENLQTTETPDEAFRFERKLSEDQNEMKTSHQAASCKSSKSSVSSLSRESGTTGHSFVPLKKRSRTWCYCCSCSWVFCYHKWSTCCHTWPSCKCSCCGWVSCCCWCWNSSHSKSSGHASPILTETERNSSVKADIPQQESDKQESEAATDSSSSCCYCFQSKQASESEVTSDSSASCCYWFDCFSCPSCTSCKCCCNY